MTRMSKSILLLGTAILSLSACSGDKGPGEIGSLDDITVRNHGQAAPAPAAKVAAAPATQSGDFSSTVEQGEAAPAAQVAAAEPLPDNSPAMQAAVKAQEEATAPLPSTMSASAGQPPVTAPTAEKPIDAIAPTTPVNETVTPPPVDAAATQTAEAQTTAPAVIPPTPSAAPSAPGNAYPAVADQGTPVPAPATTAAAAPTSATPGPSAVPAGVKYPLDANAPYSPKAVAEAAAAANVAPSAAPSTAAAVPIGNPADPATIRAAQAALKTKGGYTGAETGEIGADFLNALIMYQSKNNLPQGGLNDATLKSLGVIQ